MKVLAVCDSDSLKPVFYVVGWRSDAVGSHSYIVGSTSYVVG